MLNTINSSNVKYGYQMIKFCDQTVYNNIFLDILTIT